MKVRANTLRRSGFSIIECMVYISVFGVVLGISLMGFFKCWDCHKAMRRNAEDVVAALHAGEQWRADVRAATGRISISTDASVSRVSIPKADDVIVYEFAEGAMTRRAKQDGPAIEVLSRVRQSRMEPDARTGVEAWRWELELKPVRKQAQVNPLFTFIAVTGAK